MSEYRYPAADAVKLSKFGIDLSIYDQGAAGVTIAHVTCSEGHFQEFYNTESSYVYYVIDGEGSFRLNDSVVKAQSGDLIVAPPNTRIHYFGSMRMLLVVSPSFRQEAEHEVRRIPKVESPYQ